MKLIKLFYQQYFCNEPISTFSPRWQSGWSEKFRFLPDRKSLNKLNSNLITKNIGNILVLFFRNPFNLLCFNVFCQLSCQYKEIVGKTVNI